MKEFNIASNSLFYAFTPFNFIKRQLFLLSSIFQYFNEPCFIGENVLFFLRI